MKRKACKTNGEPSLKKANTSISSDVFQTKITFKLQKILDGLTSEIQTLSEESKPDVTSLLADDNYTTRDSKKSMVTRLGELNEGNQLLANFIDKAKSRLSELLINESVHNKGLENYQNNSTENESVLKTTSARPLQIQITKKLQALFCTALDKKVSNDVKTSGCEVITDGDWQDLSVMLQGFMSSAKKKISLALSNRSETKIEDGGHSNVSTKSSTKENYSQSKELRAFRQSSHKAPEHTPLGTTSARHNMMSSPIHSENDAYNGGGVLLLEDAERAPEYLSLTIESEVDEPPDSEEDVVVLGEKRPTYQEITLEENDQGEVNECVVEKEKRDVEETSLFQCPSCDKSFRVESLLKFHIKMHSTDTQPFHSKSTDSTSSQSKDESAHRVLKKSKKKRHSSEKREGDVLKLNTETSRKHKIYKEKQKSHKRRKHKKCSESV